MSVHNEAVGFWTGRSGRGVPEKNDSNAAATDFHLVNKLRDHLPVRSKEINSAMIPKSHFVTSFSQLSLYRIEVVRVHTKQLKNAPATTN